MIEDCGSTNGTFVNDQRISERQELKDGDRIRVGLLGLKVQMSVGIASEKKPKVHTIQEAAARTVAAVSGQRRRPRHQRLAGRREHAGVGPDAQTTDDRRRHDHRQGRRYDRGQEHRRHGDHARASH